MTATTQTTVFLRIYGGSVVGHEGLPPHQKPSAYDLSVYDDDSDFPGAEFEHEEIADYEAAYRQEEPSSERPVVALVRNGKIADSKTLPGYEVRTKTVASP